MKEVNKEEFYNHINYMDVVLNLVGNYPYTAEWKMRNTDKLIGKMVESYPENGVYPLITKFYLIE